MVRVSARISYSVQYFMSLCQLYLINLHRVDESGLGKDHLGRLERSGSVLCTLWLAAKHLGVSVYCSAVEGCDKRMWQRVWQRAWQRAWRRVWQMNIKFHF